MTVTYKMHMRDHAARLRIAGDETIGSLTGFIVGKLLGRRLHEIAGRPYQCTCNPTVHRHFRAAYRIDNNASGIRRVPDVQLQLGAKRHTAKRRAFEADIGHLSIRQPRHMIARTDMNIVGLHGYLELTGHRLGLGDLLRFQPLALEHVFEVGISAKIKLVRAVEPDSPAAKQIGQHAMHNGGSNLALDVVTQEGKAGPLEAGTPFGIGCDENGYAVDEP